MNRRSTDCKRPLLISFSGVDGSGKSTQIEHLRNCLHAAGLKTKLLAFWDDVVVGCKYREAFVHTVYESEKGVGVPDKPVHRKDKNIRAWYLTLARHGLYLADAAHLRTVVRRAFKSGADVIIMDRYIYDELANLPLVNAASRTFVDFVQGIAPKPDIAYLLDADPQAARARKPEYPVEFMQESRRAYHQLATMLRGLTIIRPLPLAQAKQAVINAASRIFSDEETKKMQAYPDSATPSPASAA